MYLSSRLVHDNNNIMVIRDFITNFPVIYFESMGRLFIKHHHRLVTIDTI